MTQPGTGHKGLKVFKDSGSDTPPSPLAVQVFFEEILVAEGTAPYGENTILDIDLNP